MIQENNKICDLHIHSTFSDSDSTVEEIFKKAQEKKLACISLTDHDTVAGVEEASRLSKIYNIEYIKGIELSTQRNNEEVHVLGYFIDEKNKKLIDALGEMKQARRERLDLMIEKLGGLGIKIDKEEVLSKCSTGVPTRLHLGICLMQKGVVKTLIEAFKKYLACGRPAYVARFKFSVDEAVEIIHESGGLAFLAHPYLLVSQDLVEDIAVKTGIDGMEFNYPNLSEAKRVMYGKIIEGNKMLKSGGSDAHGTYKKYTDVGSVAVPYEWVDQMRKRLAVNGSRKP